IPSIRKLRMPEVKWKLRDSDVSPCLPESNTPTKCTDEKNYWERCSTVFSTCSCQIFWS
uniref:Uncharacterized protein n=1 Tax=Urocitellus parryii TaxID=9999 RepID=A0A8D2GUS8_UROPR